MKTVTNTGFYLGCLEYSGCLCSYTLSDWWQNRVCLNAVFSPEIPLNFMENMKKYSYKLKETLALGRRVRSSEGQGQDS